MYRSKFGDLGIILFRREFWNQNIIFQWQSTETQPFQLFGDTQYTYPLHLNTLKALFNNVSTLKNLSCMALHAVSVIDKV